MDNVSTSSTNIQLINGGGDMSSSAAAAVLSSSSTPHVTVIRAEHIRLIVDALKTEQDVKTKQSKLTKVKEQARIDRDKQVYLLWKDEEKNKQVSQNAFAEAIGIELAKHVGRDHPYAKSSVKQWIACGETYNELVEAKVSPLPTTEYEIRMLRKSMDADRDKNVEQLGGLNRELHTKRSRRKNVINYADSHVSSKSKRRRRRVGKRVNDQREQQRQQQSSENEDGDNKFNDDGGDNSAEVNVLSSDHNNASQNGDGESVLSRTTTGIDNFGKSSSVAHPFTYALSGDDAMFQADAPGDRMVPGNNNTIEMEGDEPHETVKFTIWSLLDCTAADSCAVELVGGYQPVVWSRRHAHLNDQWFIYIADDHPRRMELLRSGDVACAMVPKPNYDKGCHWLLYSGCKVGEFMTSYKMLADVLMKRSE